ncbi:MAG: DUF488 domain-containing protein [Phycisphaerales bacterium]|nr:DUF488 domain-containing protein [Phycisphaerales bacterium]
MSAAALLTIGVYGFSQEAFFQALQDAGIDCFCDVRARRGVRGSEYAFANAGRLEARLAALGIRYVHLKHLAPSDAIRKAQEAEDARRGVPRRRRSRLGETFKTRYRKENLARLKAAALFDGELKGARRPVFFCVEGEPAACHRSLLVEELARQTGLPVEHLMP